MSLSGFFVFLVLVPILVIPEEMNYNCKRCGKAWAGMCVKESWCCNTYGCEWGLCDKERICPLQGCMTVKSQLWIGKCFEGNICVSVEQDIGETEVSFGASYAVKSAICEWRSKENGEVFPRYVFENGTTAISIEQMEFEKFIVDDDEVKDLCAGIRSTVPPF